MERRVFERFAERVAVHTYRRLRLDPRESASPVLLARLLLENADPLDFVTWLRAGNAALYERGGRRHIGIRVGAPLPYALFGVCHELAHVIFDEIGFDDERIEDACDYLGACLMCPLPAVRAIHAATGFDVSELARATASTSTWATLRLGESLDQPLIAVRWDPEPKIRFRGGAEQLPLFTDEARVLRLARGDERMPGVRKVPIDGGVRQVLLIG